MGNNMKTTVDISDSLLEAVKQFSAEHKMTLRELVEAGLRQVLKQREISGDFRLRKASFKGQGLQPGVPEGSWTDVRARIYQGRGT